MISFSWLSTEAPFPPNKVHVTKVTDRGVSLEWMPPTNDGGARISGYRVQYKEDKSDAEWKEAARVDKFDTKWTIGDLETGKNYKFAVLAENEQGLSARSNLESATPKKQLSECTLILLEGVTSLNNVHTKLAVCNIEPGSLTPQKYCVQR